MNCEKLVDELNELLTQVETTRMRIDELAPEFSIEAIDIQPQLDAYHIYHSNAIEGNSLTTEETEEVVLRGATISGKPIKDSFEARSLGAALKTARKLAYENVPFDEQALLTLHGLVLKGVSDGDAGHYRLKNVAIGGNPIQPPDPLDIPQHMAEFWWWIDNESKPLHPVIRAAVAHWWLMRIHPFADGNGRVGRLMFYFLLARAGFRLDPVILKEERMVYYECLAQADNGNLKPICEFVCKAVIRSLRMFEEKLAARKRAREALQPSFDQIRLELERQQAEKHEAWATVMKLVLQEFRYAAKEVEDSLGSGLTVTIEDLGVLAIDEWKEIQAVGNVGHRWFFTVDLQLPVRHARYVFWFSQHPTFVLDALGIPDGVGLSLSKREGASWVRLGGPRKPTLRHIFDNEGKQFALSWVDKGRQPGLKPVHPIEIRAAALEFFKEALEEELPTRPRAA